MTLSTPKKILFGLIAVLLPLLMIEAASYVVVRLFFPQAYQESKRSPRQQGPVFRTDYRGNDFSGEAYDYRKDFFGPHLQDASLPLPARLIGPRAWDHYRRIDHYTLFPFTMFHFQRHYRSAVVNTNDLGFRAWQLDSYANLPRTKIIILGGSAIFGTNLTSDDRTLSARLEAHLRQRGLDVTCINLAMGGYTSEQEMINLSRIGLRLQPSVVIAIDGYNDVVHYLKHRDLPHLYPQLADLFYRGIPPGASPGHHVKALVRHWGRYSSFFCLAGAVAGRTRPGTFPDRSASGIDNSILFPDRSHHEAIRDNYINSHDVMSTLCQARNIRYLAGLQPVCGLWVEPRWEGEAQQTILAHQDFAQVYTLLEADLQALAQKKGFPFINFGKVLAGSDNRFNFSDVVHLTDQSTEIMAQRLAAEILMTVSGSAGQPAAGAPGR